MDEVFESYVLFRGELRCDAVIVGSSLVPIGRNC
jgi:hypothetical protein